MIIATVMRKLRMLESLLILLGDASDDDFGFIFTFYLHSTLSLPTIAYFCF